MRLRFSALRGIGGIVCRPGIGVGRKLRCGRAEREPGIAVDHERIAEGNWIAIGV
ncbi:MAG: hypothetical protein ABI886_07175 [Betaproteobacteria bacterium]